MNTRVSRFAILTPLILVLSQLSCQTRFQSEPFSYGPRAGMAGGSKSALANAYWGKPDVAAALELALIESSCGKFRLINDYNVAPERAAVVSKFLEGIGAANQQCPAQDTNTFDLISLSDGLTSEQVKSVGWPVLTFSTKRTKEKSHAVLSPDFEALKGYQELFKRIDVAESKISMETKSRKLFWRGSPTGERSSERNKRLKLVRLSKELPFVDAAFTSHAQLDTWADGDQIRKDYPIVPSVSPEDSLRFLFLIDPEGNTFGYSRRAWILRSMSVLIRCDSEWIQWYSDLEDQAAQNSTPVSIASTCEKDDLKKIVELPLDQVKAIALRATEFAGNVFSQAALQAAFLRGLERSQELQKTSLESDRPVILSLTTSPKRLSKIGQVFDSLPLHQIEEIHLNLPDRYGRDGSPYDQSVIDGLRSRYPKLKVYRVGEDLGPITKIVPTMERLKDKKVCILSIDDDQGYRQSAIQGVTRRLMQHPGAVIGGSGQNLDFWRISGSMSAESSKQEHGDCHSRDVSHCDVVEGFAIIGYPSDLDYDTRLMRNLAQSERTCFVSDDLVLSFVLNRSRIPTLVVQDDLWGVNMVQSLPYGFEEDALHRRGGLGITSNTEMNAEKYQSCFKFLQSQ